HRDKALVVAFADGKPTHARMDELRGYDAMVEFLVGWTEGIFVFRDKGISQELDQRCELKQPLDRLLLDSALFQDQLNQVLSQLPNGRNTILERVWNFEDLWGKISSKPLKYLDETAVTDADKQNIFQLASLI